MLNSAWAMLLINTSIPLINTSCMLEGFRKGAGALWEPGKLSDIQHNYNNIA